MIAEENKIIQRNNKLITEYRAQYKLTNNPIEVRFRDIIPELRGTDRYTHLIHSYPAKLLVHIPYFFLNNTILSKKGNNVLDPFNGSGTVYLEALLSGRNAFGADSNPLARLIAKVKVTKYDTENLKTYIKEITKAANKSKKMVIPQVVNCDMWFSQNNKENLGRLLYQINKIQIQAVKDFMLVCLSNCVKKVSYADPRVSVPVKVNVEKYNNKPDLKLIAKNRIKEIESLDVFEKFESIALENLKRFEKLKEFPFGTRTANEISNDARNLKSHLGSDQLKTNSIHLIITSPPYAGAQKYIRSSSLNLGWLELSNISGLRDLDRKNIGRETYSKNEINITKTGIKKADRLIEKIKKINIIRANIACQYLIEMKQSINEMIRVLKNNGYLVIVIGNNKICNFEFNTQDYITTYVQDLGLTLEFKLIDSINSYGLMTKRNKTADIISREYILVFKK